MLQEELGRDPIIQKLPFVDPFAPDIDNPKYENTSQPALIDNGDGKDKLY